MSITEARKYLDTIEPVTPYVGGVLSVANVVPATDVHALLGAEYQTDACAVGGVWEEYCYVDNDPTANPPAEGVKDFEQPDLVQGSPFTAYAGVECDLADMGEAAQRAEARLGYVESRQVDEYVWAEVTTGATDVTSTTLLDAVSKMELDVAQLYGGYATLLVPRDLVVCGFSQDLFVRGPQGQIMTHQGTLVANVAVDAAKIAATGRITLVQGAVQVRSVSEAILPDGSVVPRRALAERMYVPLTECVQLSGDATCLAS